MLFFILSIIPLVYSAPLVLQSSVALPPMIAANLDEYSRLTYRLGALMSDMDTLYYTEDGAISADEMKRLVKETYETAEKAMDAKVLVVDKELKERAEVLSAKGIKLEFKPTNSENLEELQKRISKSREELADVVDDEENPEEMKKKYLLEKEINSCIAQLHETLKKMIKKGDFEKDIKASMKLLGPRGPFGIAVV